VAAAPDSKRGSRGRARHARVAARPSLRADERTPHAARQREAHRAASSIAAIVTAQTRARLEARRSATSVRMPTARSCAQLAAAAPASHRSATCGRPSRLLRRSHRCSARRRRPPLGRRGPSKLLRAPCMLRRDGDGVIGACASRHLALAASAALRRGESDGADARAARSRSPALRFELARRSMSEMPGGRGRREAAARRPQKRRMPRQNREGASRRWQRLGVMQSQRRDGDGTG
jgi:hypothetical protein